MELHPDFKELLELLNVHNVSYLVCGGYALAHHGYPRFTGDLDLLVESSSENAHRLMTALEAFGFGSLGLSADDFSKPDTVVQLGVPPVRVDLITSITGVSWEEAWNSKTQAECGGLKLFILGRDQFIANKRALGRKKDLADLEALGED
ncbi:MAG: hypothetical protein JW937_08175 [Candidatus Omnitrophica bacterium]|nr:hypothetical protein [Candidatus Omnitrophota bacterium]